MAVLVGTGVDHATGERVEVRLGISPIPPSLDGPRDAYHISAGPNRAARTIDFELSLHGWQFGFSDVRFIARMFSGADALLRCQTTFELGQSDPGPARYSLCWHTGWAEFAVIRAGTRKEPDRLDVSVHMFDPNDRSTPEHGWLSDRCTWFGFTTNIAEARRFGEELMRELRDARSRRRELGIPTIDDADWKELDGLND